MILQKKNSGGNRCVSLCHYHFGCVRGRRGGLFFPVREVEEALQMNKAEPGLLLGGESAGGRLRSPALILAIRRWNTWGGSITAAAGWSALPPTARERSMGGRRARREF